MPHQNQPHSAGSGCDAFDGEKSFSQSTSFGVLEIAFHPPAYAEDANGC